MADQVKLLEHKALPPVPVTTKPRSLSADDMVSRDVMEKTKPSSSTPKRIVTASRGRVLYPMAKWDRGQSVARLRWGLQGAVHDLSLAKKPIAEALQRAMDDGPVHDASQLTLPAIPAVTDVVAANQPFEPEAA